MYSQNIGDFLDRKKFFDVVHKFALALIPFYPFLNSLSKSPSFVIFNSVKKRAIIAIRKGESLLYQCSELVSGFTISVKRDSKFSE